MVRKHNAFINTISPEIHLWMMQELQAAIDWQKLSRAYFYLLW